MTRDYDHDRLDFMVKVMVKVKKNENRITYYRKNG